MLDYRMDTFLSLCETQSYTKTAEHLHLTQPSVTQHIKYLEHFYQCPLFHYDGKRVEMTEAGQYLRDKVILQRAQNVEIRKRLQTLQETAAFEIGITPSATFSFALPRLCAYANRESEPHIQIHVGNTRRLLKRMQSGMLDAIIMEGELPDMLVDSTELCRENIIAAASPELSEQLYGCSWGTLLKQPLIVPDTGTAPSQPQRHFPVRFPGSYRGGFLYRAERAAAPGAWHRLCAGAHHPAGSGRKPVGVHLCGHSAHVRLALFRHHA